MMSTLYSASPIAKSPLSPSAVRHQAGSKNNEDTHVQVICRLRPLSEFEISKGRELAVEVLDPQTVCVNNKESQLIFSFDQVCDITTPQQAMYDLVARNTLQDLFRGFNGTILAYGQTGAGKSHTMFGTQQDPGIIPRICKSIFTHIAQGSPDVEYTVSVSLMEIYQEHIKDLLNPFLKNSEYTIHEDKTNGVYVRGLSHAFVASAAEMSQVLAQGSKHRTKSPTNMNEESSRSHAIFQVMLSQEDVVSGAITKSKLFLVDLAGSEKVDKTGASGNSLEEAKKINLSLSVLGLVINSLTDLKSTHVPYRDSKLTRILQESLGGNSRTSLIINCSPALSCVQETISTLRFGTRAKHITNTVHVNRELSFDQLKARVVLLEKQNKELEQELSSRNRLSSSPKNISLMSPRGTSRIPLPLDKLGAVHDEIKRKDERIVQLEEELLELKMTSVRDLHDEDLKLYKLESALHKLSDKLGDVELINDNLRKHLLISEKIIEAREVKIDKLRVLLGEQQAQVKKESTQFENKLRLLKERLDEQSSRETSFLDGHDHRASAATSTIEEFFGDAEVASELLQSSPLQTPVRDSIGQFDSPSRSMAPSSPTSPRLGLNLRIVKPLRGGSQETAKPSDSA